MDKPKSTLDVSALEGEALSQWDRITAAISEVEKAFQAADCIPSRMLRIQRLELVQRLKGVKKDPISNRKARLECQIQKAESELQRLSPVEDFPLEDLLK